MSLAVVGVAYPNADRSNRRFILAMCRPGDPIALRPEPKNAYDEHAVQVLNDRGEQLGYLTAERAPRIGAMIRQGREVRAAFQAQTAHGAWIRVAFDGDEPVVPEQRETAEDTEIGDPSTAFWPDEVFDG